MSSSRVGMSFDIVEQIRNRVDIVPLISAYVPIKKQGRNYWACCPFHHEKTASFCIYEEEQSFHCFGCGVSGDLFTFIMKIESLEFLDAVELIAKRNGIAIPEYKSDYDAVKKKKKKDRFLSLLKDANEKYKSNLKLSKTALEYLEKRELTEKEIKDFEIGYSLGRKDIIDYLSSKGYTVEEMLEVGVAKRNEKGDLYDFFSNRLMFPLFNKFGDCIGFSGRDLEGTSPAKYKNSSQSIVFDKSSTIFAFNKVKDLSKSQKIEYVILCEGQIDVISMHKAGFNTAMACLGTALTEMHAKEISRICKNVILCLDGDSAGVNATLKAIPILKAQMLNVKVASIIGGKDPDEIIKNYGKEKMTEIINSAIDSVEFEIRQLAKNYNLEDVSDKAKFVSGAIKILNAFETLSEKEVYIPIISSLSNISPVVIRSDLSKNTSNSVVKTQNTQNVENYTTYNSLIKSQQFILASLLHNKDYANFEEDFDLCLRDATLIKLFEFIKDKKRKNEKINVTSIFDLFDEELIKGSLAEILTYDFEQYGDNLKKHYAMCLQKIKLKKIEFELNELSEKLKEEKDITKRNELAKQVQDLIKHKKIVTKAEDFNGKN